MSPNATMATRFQQLVLTSTILESSSIQTTAVSDQQHGRNQTDEDQTTVDDAVSLGLTMSNMLKDVAETAGSLPYLKGIAGIVSQLLQIRQEVQVYKKRCDELLEKVLRNGTVVVKQWRMLKDYRDEAGLKPFFEQLGEYQSLLNDVYCVLQKVKSRGRLYRIFNRGLDDFNELDRKIESFGRNLDSIGITQLIVNQQQVNQNTPRLPLVDVTTLLPPGPICVLERDTEREKIVDALLSSSNARVTVLGMGGIGKTTLACSAMRDPRVVEAYPRSLFISFEGLSTPDLVYNTLANTFNIPSEFRKSTAQVLEQIKDCLGREKTIICVDNFETFWEVQNNRPDADSLIGHLASLSTLAIIVTLRGIQSPGNNTVRWVKVGPLTPLSQTASDALVREIAGDALCISDGDEIHNLCEAVEGVPLAVTLIGKLLQDGSETPQSLWHRWTTESTYAIGTDVKDRQYHLDVSLKLSVFGPRMNNESRAVLGMIAVLPAGLSAEDSWLDELQPLLPSSLHLRDCLRVLQNAALCSREQNSTPHRFQLLSPIRQYCLKEIPRDLEAIHKLIDLYTMHISDCVRLDSHLQYAWFTNELTNITAILNLALSLPYITESLGYACASYTRWMGYLGSYTTDIICKATNAQSAGSKAKARCLQSHAYVLVRQSQKDAAIDLLQEAMSIHRDLGDQVEEAHGLEELGRCYRLLRRYDNADEASNKALKLFQEQEDQLGEANCRMDLAYLYEEMDKHTDAETSAKQALELYRALVSRLGQANALHSLGWLYLRQGQLELAIGTAQEAHRLSIEIKDTYGQATAMRCLGWAHAAGGSLGRAASCFQEAICLYEECASPEGAEEARCNLARVLSILELEPET